MYEMTQKVLFKHCDPAGIAFYPRIFEMMNDCVEAFFTDVLDWPFEEMLKETGVPTARITSDFVTPCRHGEELVLRLEVTRLGRTSMAYEMTATCGDAVRFRSTATLVHATLAAKPVVWPDAIREKLGQLVRAAA